MPEVEGEHRVCVKTKNWRGRALQNTEKEKGKYGGPSVKSLVSGGHRKDVSFPR